jgi:hypothetical protein
MKNRLVSPEPRARYDALSDFDRERIDALAEFLKAYSTNAIFMALSRRGKAAMAEEAVQDGLVGQGTYDVIAAVGPGIPSVDSFAFRLKGGRLQFGLGRRLTGPKDSVGKWCFVGGGPERTPRMDAIVRHWWRDQGKKVHVPKAFREFSVPFEYAPEGTPGFVGVDNGKWSYAITVGVIICDDDEHFQSLPGLSGEAELAKVVWHDAPPPDDECAYNMGPCIRKCWDRTEWLMNNGLLKYNPNAGAFVLD